jgi:hypothetical protein
MVSVTRGKKQEIKETRKHEATVPLADLKISAELCEQLKRTLEETGLTVDDLVEICLQQINLIVKRTKETTPSLPKPDETSKSDSDRLEYREVLVEKAEKLKNEGMSLVRIADIFNEEKLSTLSGNGKWYPSSIGMLLKRRTKR